jgi:hypothetical protein
MASCEPACPQDAIYTDIKPPAEVAEYIEDNRRFFAELLPGRAAPVGNPGGSAKIGSVGVDTPAVASYSPDAGGA